MKNVAMWILAIPVLLFLISWNWRNTGGETWFGLLYKFVKWVFRMVSEVARL